MKITISIFHTASGQTGKCLLKSRVKNRVQGSVGQLRNYKISTSLQSTLETFHKVSLIMLTNYLIHMKQCKILYSINLYEVNF